MSILTLNFKIVPETLVSDTGGDNHLSIPRLDLNFKILSEILVSDSGRVSIIFPYSG